MKKVLSTLMIVATIISMMACIAVPASAAAVGTMLSNAQVATFGETYFKFWTKDTDHLNHYVKFTTDEQGIVTVKATKPSDAEGEYGELDFVIYDVNGDLIWDYGTIVSVNNAKDHYKFNIGLAAGTYYMTIKPGFTVRSGLIETTYDLSFEGNSNCEIEPNGSGITATSIVLNQKYTGYFGDEYGNYEDSEYFKFSVVAGNKYRICWYGYENLDRTTTIVHAILPDGENDGLYNTSTRFDENGNNYAEFEPKTSGTAYIYIYNYKREQFKYEFMITNQTCADSGHTYDSGIVTEPATCSATGKKTVTCLGCGATATETIAKTDHAWDGGARTEATCTAEGKIVYTCTSCKTTKSETIAKKDHAWDGGARTEATCAAEGKIVYTCTSCKTTKSETIAKKDHSWDSGAKTEATCTAEGKIVYTCTSCKTTKSESIAKKDHSWDGGKVTTAPTSAKAGVKTFTCSGCSATRTESIPAVFTDVKSGAFYENAVDWAVEKDVTNGLTATTFGPSNACTRGQIVTFLWRAAGSPEPKSTTNPFTDVKEGKFYYKAVLWAVENGITNGLTATTFGPGNTCTRGQVVTFLWRAKGGEKVSASNPFTDVNKGFYVDAVAWAVKNDITSGTTATTFSPANKCTRGQIVTFLYRAYK